MKRTNTLRILITLIYGCAICGLWAQPGSHDPSNIVKEGNRFWAFHTGNGVYVTSASDSTFTNWKNEGGIYSRTAYPSWINEHVPGFGGHFWAPDVIYMNGEWRVYYSCSTFGSSRSAIGLTTTTSLASKTWTDQGMVTSTTESSNMNAIDPDVFKAKDGRYWMTYGSFWRGIVVTEIDSVTGKPKNVNDITLIANGDPEAPAIIYKNDYYYLFFNRGKCCSGLQSTYQIYVGRASNPKGPYLDKNGKDCNKGGGSVFMHHDGKFIGPGHFGLYGDDLISYHYYDGFDNGVSKMTTAKLKWEDGWPIAEYERTGKLKDGVYTLTNKNSLTVLKTMNDATTNGTSVVIGKKNNVPTERWIVKSESDMSYKIYLEAAPTRTLEIPNCSTSGGSTVGIWSDLLSGSPCQNWYMAQIRKSDGSFYVLYNRNSGLVMEVQNASKDENAKVVQSQSNGDACQQWLFREVTPSSVNNPVDDDNLRIFGNRNQKCIDITYEGSMVGAAVSVFNSMGSMLYKGILSEATLTIPLSAANQIYLVSVTDTDNQTINKKIIL